MNEANNCFSMYQTSGEAPNSPFFLRNEGKLLREIQNNGGRYMLTADTILSLSSQSEHAKNTIHLFGMH